MSAAGALYLLKYSVFSGAWTAGPVVIVPTVTLEGLPPQLEAMWRSLESKADGSFFTSWTWIGAWLRTYAAEAPCKRLLVARCGDRVVGLGIICRTAQRRFLGGTEHAVLLNQTGARDDAAAFIEYNGFLMEKGAPQGARAALLDFICSAPELAHGVWNWNEFRMAGVDGHMIAAMHESPHRDHTIRGSDCPWIDLDAVKPGLDGYLGALSSNARAQIRRAVRLYEQAGPLTVTRARTAEEAGLFMQELRELHEVTWRQRTGGPGAFMFPLFAHFTAALVEIGHGTGNVDLLRVTAGEATVGILLNFVHAGQVYAYQSGLAYSKDNRLKPGLVSHALAVMHYKSRALDGYHFMAGEGRYKASLGTATETLSWVSVRRPDFRSRLEDSLRGLKAGLLRTKEDFKLTIQRAASRL